jgi:hypothetical protein
MNLWTQLLDTRIAAQKTWQHLLGPNFDAVSRFLTPTGSAAEFLPCDKTSESHCGYKIRPGIEHDEVVGYCPEGECSRIDLTSADVALLTVDWSLLLSEIATALELQGQPNQESPGLGQLGWIVPGEGKRFPVFFAATVNRQSPFPALQRFAARSSGTPFVFVTHSRSVLDVDSLGILSASKAEAVFLDMDVAIERSGSINAPEAAQRLMKFAIASAGSTAKEGPTQMILPEGADWQDVTIREVDGHTVEVFCQVRMGKATKEVRQTYTFENLGLSKRTSAGAKPSIAWENFLIPIISRKRIAASSSVKWARMRKWKEEIAAILHHVTGLPADGAFEHHRGRHCYEANFKVECDPRDIVPIPDAPRRLNQKCKVARSPDDE